MMQQFHQQSPDHWQALLQQSAGMWLAYDGMNEDAVSKITTPALLILGDRDELISVESVLDLYRRLPDAELAIMPGAAHMQPLRDPAIFAALLLGFFQRH
jgi:pimeloyl-ACP methyl ester carboxylesterase